MSDSEEEWVDAEEVEDKALNNEIKSNVYKADPARKRMEHKDEIDTPDTVLKENEDLFDEEKKQETEIKKEKVQNESVGNLVKKQLEKEKIAYRNAPSENNVEEQLDAIPEVETIVDLQLAKREKERGNNLFRAKDFDSALAAYSSALSCTPTEEDSLKAAIFANKAACYVNLELWDDVVKECEECLRIDEGYIKALLRRARAYEMLKKYQEAVGDWKKILESDPGNKLARINLSRLEPLAKEQFEKQKEEVMGQMKKLGDSVLGWFGMSTDDFQMVQDPNTGSYSVNVNKNKQSK